MTNKSIAPSNKQTTRRRVRFLTETGPIIDVKNLSIKAGNRQLLEDAEFQILKGEIVLLVGGSGAGKSVLTKIFMGLIHTGSPDFEITGEVKIMGKEILHNRKNRAEASAGMGIVFQDFGLFDEFSVRENIDFAFCHSSDKLSRTDRNKDTSEYIKELGIDEKVKIYSCSGGQKQRIAVARTLAFNPEIILYDEPTSGLDPHHSQKVADLIRRTNSEFHVTSVIITHDYDFLMPIANRILFLDTTQKKLREIKPTELKKIVEQGQFTGIPQYHTPPKKTIGRTLGQIGKKFLENSTRLVEAFIQSILHLFPFFISLKWGIKYFKHYFFTICGLPSMLYISVCGIIMGFVSTYFIFKFLPQRHYTEPLIIDEVLSGIGYALYRIIIPVIATILVAARCGAAVAADVGNRVYTKQTNAIQSFGANPSHYLFTNIIYAFLLGVPILTFICFITAKTTSLLVFTLQNPEYSPLYWDANFHRFLRKESYNTLYWGTNWVLAKTLVCALGIASISYYQGISSKTSGREVNNGITSTVLWSTLFVLIVHFVFAFFEFKKPIV